MNFNIFGVFKNNFFGGYEDFVDIFWGNHKIGIYLGVISMRFMVFSKGQDTECWIFFWVAKISNIFWGC